MKTEMTGHTAPTPLHNKHSAPTGSHCYTVYYRTVTLLYDVSGTE